MNYFNRLNKAVNFIEANLQNEITLKQVASEAGFSLYHFHRIFHSLVGDSLKEYIRKRRLSCAAHELNFAKKNITETAFDYQYSTPESFSRAFKKQFSVNPSHFLKKEMILNLYEKVNLDENISNLLKGFENITPEIISKHDFLVLGEKQLMSLENEANIQQEIDFAEDFQKRGRWEKIPQRKYPNKAIALGWDLDTTANCYTQILGAEVTLPDKIPDGFILHSVPAAKYARFKIDGLRPVIQMAWDNILDSWSAQSQFERDRYGMHMEIYNQQWSGLEPGSVEIYIPLK